MESVKNISFDLENKLNLRKTTFRIFEEYS